jgi:hypothetical protein
MYIYIGIYNGRNFAPTTTLNNTRREGNDLLNDDGWIFTTTLAVDGVKQVWYRYIYLLVFLYTHLYLDTYCMYIYIYIYMYIYA